MRRFVIMLLSVVLALILAACGGRADIPIVTPAQPETQDETTAHADETVPEPADTPSENTSDALVVYFSRVGNTAFPEDVDVVSSASLSRTNGALKGNAQLMAEWIADEAEADLFEIQTAETYPVDYRETTDVAKGEQNENARPALKSHIESFEAYVTVYLVFPNWWGDLPMPLYAFFDEYDFSGKTLYVSITHEGSSFSRTVSTIRGLEPDADVIEGISIRGSAVPQSEETVRQFVKGNQ